MCFLVCIKDFVQMKLFFFFKHKIQLNLVREFYPPIEQDRIDSAVIYIIIWCKQRVYISRFQKWGLSIVAPSMTEGLTDYVYNQPTNQGNNSLPPEQPHSYTIYSRKIFVLTDQLYIILNNLPSAPWFLLQLDPNWRAKHH